MVVFVLMIGWHFFFLSKGTNRATNKRLPTAGHLGLGGRRVAGFSGMRENVVLVLLGLLLSLISAYHTLDTRAVLGCLIWYDSRNVCVAHTCIPALR